MLGGYSGFIYFYVEVIVRFCVGDSCGCKSCVDEGRDFVFEEFKEIVLWKVFFSCFYYEVGYNFLCLVVFYN